MAGGQTLLQLALDIPSEEDALNVARQTEDLVDVIEAGTPLIIYNGLGIVRKLRSEFPEHVLVADVKIMDAGRNIASMAYDAGADFVTVMAAASSFVLDEVIDVAQDRERQVMLDLLGTKITEESIEKINNTCVNLVIVHRARQANGVVELPINAIAELLKNGQIPFGLAGRIKPEAIPSIISLEPHFIIVGSAITRADDPVSVVATIRRLLQ